MNSRSRDLEELEDPENWDFDNVQIHPPVKNPRAVVSVEFNRDELDQIAITARRLGMSLTTFVREAALRCSAPADADSHNHLSPAKRSVSRSDSETIQSPHGIKD